MKVLLLLAAVLAAVSGDISEILRGQNAIGGIYYHDASGQYRHDDSGRYVPDDSGRYTHQDNPYLHDPNPHPPYEHVQVPHVPYEHVHVPHLPYVHVDNPYEHVDVPHQPYDHVDVPHSPYVHEQRTYLPPPTPKPPEPGYFYAIPNKSLQTEPVLPPRPVQPKITPIPTLAPKPTIRPLFTPAASTIRPFTVAPTASAKGGGPYRWNLFQSGDHKVEHPEYNLQVGLRPHA